MTSDVQAGNQRDWILYFEEQITLTEKYEALEARLEAVEAITDATGTMFIRNTAAHVLLFAYGDQPKNDSPTKRVQNLKATDHRHTKIRKLVEILDTTTEDKFKSMADQVINRRHSDVHPDNVPTLDSEVERCMKIFDKNPSLVKQVRQEHYVLANYEIIKQAFEL